MMDTVIDLNPTKAEGFSIADLLRRSARALLDPGRFFRVDFPSMSTSQALAFGIGNAWAASVVSFFFQTMNSLLLSRLLDRWMQRMLSAEEGFSVWTLSPNSFLYTAGLLLLGPFLFLAITVLKGFGLYAFARLLIEDRPSAPEPVTFEGALRIEAAVLASGWYAVVPVFGGLLSFLAGIVLTITGVRERFGVSTRRAFAVVFAPYLLLAFIALFVGGLFLMALTQIPLQELLSMDPQSLGL